MNRPAALFFAALAALCLPVWAAATPLGDPPPFAPPFDELPPVPHLPPDPPPPVDLHFEVPVGPPTDLPFSWLFSDRADLPDFEMPDLPDLAVGPGKDVPVGPPLPFPGPGHGPPWLDLPPRGEPPFGEPPSVATPEPNTWLLLGMGLAGLAGVSRRRRA